MPRNLFYLEALESGSPRSIRLAHFAVALVLVLLVAVPTLAVGARVFA